ncbi:hypothetical protein TNCV_953671 [Trichonephila clavipes]|nr:hypothetical protein TNCV_953671 [Trichonephila clavipes]
MTYLPPPFLPHLQYYHQYKVKLCYPPISIPTTTNSPSNNLNTSASLSTEVSPVLTTANKFAALPTEAQSSVSLSEFAAPTSNNEHLVKS